MAEPSFESDLKIEDSSFLVKLKGEVAEDIEIVMKCIELQTLFKQKIKEDNNA